MSEPNEKLSERRFTPLQESHRPVIEELLARYSREELVELLQGLPEDRRAAKAVWPQFYAFTPCPPPPMNYIYYKAPRGLLAAYAAAVLTHSASKVLLRIKERAEQNKADLDFILGAIRTAEDRGCVKLSDAMRGRVAEPSTAVAPSTLIDRPSSEG